MAFLRARLAADTCNLMAVLPGISVLDICFCTGLFLVRGTFKTIDPLAAAGAYLAYSNTGPHLSCQVCGVFVGPVTTSFVGSASAAGLIIKGNCDILTHGFS